MKTNDKGNQAIIASLDKDNIDLYLSVAQLRAVRRLALTEIGDLGKSKERFLVDAERARKALDLSPDGYLIALFRFAQLSGASEELYSLGSCWDDGSSMDGASVALALAGGALDEVIVDDEHPHGKLAISGKVMNGPEGASTMSNEKTTDEDKNILGQAILTQWLIAKRNNGDPIKDAEDECELYGYGFDMEKAQELDEDNSAGLMVVATMAGECVAFYANEGLGFRWRVVDSK